MVSEAIVGLARGVVGPGSGGDLLAGSLAGLLILLLVQRELLAAVGSRYERITRYLTMAIRPLLIAFGIVVIGRLMAYL